MVFRHILIATVALATAGCSIGQDYVRPDAPVPAAGRADTPGEAVAWPSPDWWRGFGSATLDDYIQRAQHNNTDIAAAAARVLQAAARARIAGADLLPSLDASADVARSYIGDGTGSAVGRGSRTRTSYSAAIAASYELDVWGRNRAALASAEALVLSSRYDRETVALTITADVATLYFQILELQDRLTIAHDNLANAEQVLAVVEARVANGAASALELAQQRTVVANQRASIPPLEQQLRQAENLLAVLLGEAPDAVAVPAGTLDAISIPVVVPGIPSELLARRPDIRNAEAQLVAANADITVARAAFFPSIPLTGQAGFESLALSSLFDSSGFFYSLVAGLTQPIFQGGRLAGQVDLTEARYEELVQVYRRTVIAAFSDVENALVAIRQLDRQLVLQEEAVEQARLAFELADARYRAGAVDLLTVLDAQRTLFQARDQLVQIKSARLQATVSLFRALGGGWQDDVASGND
ncbi:MAG TPA: efflux transporter outer membrane subunit [Alphaproteobacteria bacterium]